MKNVEEVAEQEVLVTISGEDCRQEDPARLMEKAMLSHDLGLALAKIGEKEAKIVRMRYGLNGLTPMTLNDIAKKIGLSRERVRQIEERALLRLRRVAGKIGLIELARRPDHTALQPGWAKPKR